MDVKLKDKKMSFTPIYTFLILSSVFFQFNLNKSNYKVNADNVCFYYLISYRNFIYHLFNI